MRGHKIFFSKRTPSKGLLLMMVSSSKINVSCTGFFPIKDFKPCGFISCLLFYCQTYLLRTHEKQPKGNSFFTSGPFFLSKFESYPYLYIMVRVMSHGVSLKLPHISSLAAAAMIHIPDSCSAIWRFLTSYS